MEKIIGFCACKANTGKTTLLLKLLTELRTRGVPTAVLKHGHHTADTGHIPDSSRYLSAGAEGSLFVSPGGWLLELRPEEELPLEQAAALLRQLTGAHLVLVEGYKKEKLPKIAVCRSDVCLELPCPEEELLAVVSDVPLETALPQFRPDDITGICDFILE